MLFADVVDQSASKVIQETALGAIAVIALGIAGWLLVRLTRTQDAWLKDKDAAAERAEKSNEKDRERSDKHTEAIREMSEAIRENTRALSSLATTTNAHQSTQSNAIERLFDFLRMAVKPSGTMPAVRKPERDDR
jgi:ABC-type protease/lipase transport system fused ATPase/permease subunit